MVNTSDYSWTKGSTIARASGVLVFRKHRCHAQLTRFIREIDYAFSLKLLQS